MFLNRELQLIITIARTGGLVDTTTDKVYDITADQYYHVGQTPPYPGKKKTLVWLEAKTPPKDIRSNG